jgi:hypothetical protein
MKPPVIVIPGITATSLVDHYPGEPESLWGLPWPRKYDRTALHPDDLRYERVEPSLVRPGEVFSIPYDQLVRELRHDLSADSDHPRPVYLFGYDWRQPLEASIAALEAFIQEVVDRTRLLRHYHKSGFDETPAVDLVGHSMGGLLIAGLLAERERAASGRPSPVAAGGSGAGAPPVRRVVTLGTPFGGSFEAVVKIITGTAQLGSGQPSSRERETARVTPALYYLLPRFEGALLLGDGALPDTLFDPELWQRGVVDSIAEHLRHHSLAPSRRKADRREDALRFLGDLLDQASRFRDRVDALDLTAAGLGENDWLAIAGVGEETRVRLSIQGPPDDPFFDLRSLDRVQGYPAEPGGAPEEETGDGTVPWAGAVPAFLEPEQLVAVSPDDYGYWEIGDRVLSGIAGLHSLMPSMNHCIKLTGTFLNGREGERTSAHRSMSGRRPPGVGEEDWRPPIRFGAD